MDRERSFRVISHVQTGIGCSAVLGVDAQKRHTRVILQAPMTGAELTRGESGEESMQSKTEDGHNGAGAVTFSFQYDLASVPYTGDSVRPYCASGDR